MKERAQILTILPVLLFGVISAVGAFYFVANEEKTAALGALAHSAINKIEILDGELHRFSRLLISVAGFFDHGQSLSADEFASSAVPDFSDYKGLGAVAWVPRVDGTERARFEQLQSGSGQAGFQILEGSPGRYESAGTRDEYFPIQFAASSEQANLIIGFDMGSEATRLEMVVQARNSREDYATPLITSVDELGLERAFLVAVPVFDQGVGIAGGLAPRGELRGFAIAGIVLDELVALAHDRVAGSTPLDLYIFQDNSQGH